MQINAVTFLRPSCGVIAPYYSEEQRGNNEAVPEQGRSRKTPRG